MRNNSVGQELKIKKRRLWSFGYLKINFISPTFKFVYNSSDASGKYKLGYLKCVLIVSERTFDPIFAETAVDYLPAFDSAFDLASASFESTQAGCTSIAWPYDDGSLSVGETNAARYTACTPFGPWR